MRWIRISCCISYTTKSPFLKVARYGTALRFEMLSSDAGTTSAYSQCENDAATIQIPERRLTKNSFIFPVELRHAFVTYSESRAGSAFVLHQHETLSFIQAQLFLIL